MKELRGAPQWFGESFASMPLQNSINRMSTQYGGYPPRMRFMPPEMLANLSSQNMAYTKHLQEGVLLPKTSNPGTFAPNNPYNLGLSGPVQDVLSGCPCQKDGSPIPRYMHHGMGYRRDETYRTVMGVAAISAVTFLFYKAFIDRGRSSTPAPQIV